MHNIVQIRISLMFPIIEIVKNNVFPLYCGFVRPLLEYCAQFCPIGLSRDRQNLEFKVELQEWSQRSNVYHNIMID